MRCSTPATPQPGQSILPKALTDHSNIDTRFNTITVLPITDFTYKCDQGNELEGKGPSYFWATLLSKVGANIEPPPSAEKMPFVPTPPSPQLDVAIREMLTHNVLVVNNDIRAAFQLIVTHRPDGTYDAVQDFQIWEKLYPRRNYVKLIMSAHSIQRISPYDKMIKIKLTNMLAQLSVVQEMQKYCGVVYRGCYFSMTRLPPRHPRSAHIAQRWVEVVGEVIERMFGVYTVMYQDEWLVHAVDLNAQEVVNFVEQTLGVHIDRKKSVLEPTTDLEFFGLRVSSAQQTVRISDNTRDVLIECMKHVGRYDVRERDNVACLWWWVAYHLRLPRLIEDDILTGKADMITVALVDLDIYAPRQIKRARRKIFVYADVLKDRVVACAPEFDVQIDKNMSHITSTTDEITNELLSAIESAKWALKEFVPDGVDLAIYINSAEAHMELTRGSYAVIKPIMKSYIKLYNKVKSRNVIWHSTKSSVSVRALLKHIDSLEKQTEICDLIKRTVSILPHEEPKRKIKGRAARMLRNSLKKVITVNVQPPPTQSLPEIPVTCEERSESKVSFPPPPPPPPPTHNSSSFVGLSQTLSLKWPYFPHEKCQVKISTHQNGNSSSEEHSKIPYIGMSLHLTAPAE